MIQKVICCLSVFLILAPFVCEMRVQAETVAVSQPLLNRSSQEAKTDLLNKEQTPAKGSQQQPAQAFQSVVAQSLLAPTTSNSSSEKAVAAIREKARKSRAAAVAVSREYGASPDQILRDGRRKDLNSQAQLPTEFQSLPARNVELAAQNFTTAITSGLAPKTSSQFSQLADPNQIAQQNLTEKMPAQSQEGAVPEKTVEVSNWKEFVDRARDKTVGSIKLTQSITADGYGASGTNVDLNDRGNVGLIIDGGSAQNELNLDKYTLRFTANVPANQIQTFTAKNLTVKQTNSSGLFNISSSSKNNNSNSGTGQVVWDNFAYQGPRGLTANNFDLIIKNKVSVTTDTGEIAKITNVEVWPGSDLSGNVGGVNAAFWFYNNSKSNDRAGFNIYPGPSETAQTKVALAKTGSGSSLLYTINNLNIAENTDVNLDSGPNSFGIIDQYATGGVYIGANSKVTLDSSQGTGKVYSSAGGAFSVGQGSQVTLKSKSATVIDSPGSVTISDQATVTATSDSGDIVGSGSGLSSKPVTDLNLGKAVTLKLTSATGDILTANGDFKIGDKSDVNLSSDSGDLIGIKGSLTIGKKAIINLKSDGVLLGKTGSFSKITPIKDLIVDSEADVTLTAGSKTAITSSGDLQLNANAKVKITSSSGTMMDISGNLKVGNAATITAKTEETSSNTMFFIGSNLLLAPDAKIDLTSGASSSSSAISMAGTGPNQILLEDRASLKIEYLGDLPGKGQIFYSNNPTNLTINPDATLNIKANKTTTDSSVSMLQLGNTSTVNVTQGTLDLQTNNTGSTTMLVSGSNSTINLNQAKKVNLGSTAPDKDSEGKVVDNSTKVMKFGTGTNYLNLKGETASYNDTAYDLNFAENGKADSKVQWNDISMKQGIPLSSNAAPTSQPLQLEMNTGRKRKGQKYSKTDLESGNRTKISFLSNFNPAEYRRLTISPHLAGTPLETPIDVSNWDELESAMLDPAITSIAMTADIGKDVATSNDRDIENMPSKAFILDGQKHNLDVRKKRWTIPGNVPLDWKMSTEIKNVQLYGVDYYGPWRYTGRSSSSNPNSYGDGAIRYRDMSYEGAQLTASYYYNTEFQGTVKNKSVPNYTSPINGEDVKTQNGNLGAVRQVNIEAGSVDFLEGCNYEGNSSAGLLRISASSDDAGVFLAKGATVNLTSDNPRSGGAEYDSIITANANFSMAESSTLNINLSASYPQTAINLTSGAKKVRFTVGHNAKLNILLNETDKSLNTGNTSLSNKNIITTSSNTDFQVKDEGELNISGTTYRAGGSSTTAPNANNSIINTSGDFTIGKHGILNLDLEGGPKSINLFYANGRGSSVSFKDAERVNLDFSKVKNISNLQLINMAKGSTFKAEVQSVQAWKKASPATKTDPDFSWLYVSLLDLTYNGTAITEYNIQALTSADKTSLSKNYKTVDFKHLLFEHIEDINLTMDELNHESTQITGTATPGSEIYFSSDAPSSELPEPQKVTGDGEADINKDYPKYHVKVGADGKYTLDLGDQRLTKGTKIMARAYRQGKEQKVFQIVDGGQEPVDPDEPDKGMTTPDPGDSDNSGTHLQGKLSINYVSNFNFGKQTIGTEPLKALAQAQYPRVQVVDKRTDASGWQLQAKMDPLAYTDDQGLSHELVGAQLVLVPKEVKTTSENTSLVPDVPDDDFVLTSANRVVMQADSSGDQGKGVWLSMYDPAKTHLLVYPGTATANVNYSSSIEWTLAIGP
ncbi:WxL domain-containing protein [Lactobacillus sp. DCY120]|uniref:WxL domain-containing protein n=1 Tax=Bombilactobacillus apium TaxID=2675299 RepID=A0A850RCI2_9LACO|nr:WxL domain-containing protein [Bombilactobacillus apium]NVY96478.1 WxL domain-containing protein [Bombilactobacillus apium]